jgi:2,3-bisphosphoglycerate-dependent phosphoglycerate mutase
MQLYFIRHAQSQNNALWEQASSYQGRSEDPELTATGLMQAALLANFLQGMQGGHARDGADLQNSGGFGLTHLYTSPMLRAIETASAIAAAVDLPLEVWTDLHEGGGIFLDDPESGRPVGRPGKSRSELLARFPVLRLPASFGEAGWWNRPLESRDERRDRARRVCVDLVRRHGGQDHRVAIFSHGGFYNHLLSALIGTDDRDGTASEQAAKDLRAENVIFGLGADIWFSLNNAAITRIDFTPDEIKIVYQNRLDYLPAGLVT